ncbi:DUF4148 domain-containing protein [Methylibium petroleiphilum]|uniref:DUF4148 domain-containing protein n=1 Tax=Methylibium petroleiphilum TaxID=105560 RepID=UPI001ACB482B|nr:DUF4148 domain-containing protein [Methylibium petroleiphilum]MBN9206146.1 DUF4148 domain-containing protein [Methylibium petroleiphilum]
MRFHKFAIATVAAVSAIALPGLSQATSIYHAASGEAGFTFHPDHATNGKSRAEVLAELEAARKDGTLALIQRGAPLPIKQAGPAKTRQQVIDEMRSESPEQRRQRLELTAGG